MTTTFKAQPWCDTDNEDALDTVPAKPDYAPDNDQGYSEEVETVVKDFMSDLRHFCDAAGLDWEYLWESSYDIGYGPETGDGH